MTRRAAAHRGPVHLAAVRLVALAVAAVLAAVAGAAPAAAGAIGAGGTGSDPVAVVAADRVVVTLAPGQSPAQVARELERQGLAVTSRIDQIGALVLDAGSAAGRDAALARLGRDPRFASAEPSHLLWAAGTPNDPMLSTEWWLDAIDVKPAWDWPAPATPVTIATIDTGVDFHNPDLAAIVLPGRNFVTPGAQPQDDSVIGHGTHVAGIAAAAVNDGIGMAGVAPWARILPVKVLDAEGFADDTTAAAGIVWAADQGAQVVNLSIEGAPDDPCSAALTDAVAYARSKNAVVVGASGNSSSAVGCPARIPGVLSVGAVDQALAAWPRSNRGPQLSLVAPGVGITSTVPVGMGGHGVLTGTSMAAPMVSGAAAIIAGAAPGIDEAAIRAALTSTAKDLGLPGRDDTYGAGLVDVGAALAATAEPVTGASVSPALLIADGSGAADAATLAFHVAVPITATVAVESPDGTVVRTLSTGALAAGDTRVTWDARDDAGAPVPDGTYRFAIRGTAPGGLAVSIVRPVGVSLALASARLSLAAISPNGDGKADRTSVAYALRAPATVTVTVRDAGGRTIRTLASGARSAGDASIAWDGRVGSGTSAAVAPDGAYTITVAATTTRGTYAIPLAVSLSIHGVAVSGLRATSVYPAPDGYHDRSAVTYTQGGTATATLYVYPATSSTPLRAIALGKLARGKVSAAWDGRDAAGRIVRAGTYRIRIRTLDAGKVVRWSAYTPVTVSAKHLVQRVFTTTLRGDQYDPRTFVSSPDAASVGASTSVPGGVRLQATGPDDRAAAFWVVALPAWTTVRAATLRVTSVRDAEGESLVGTWNGTTVDGIGFVQRTGTTDFPFPASSLASLGRSVALAASQDGPGFIDVASLRLEVTYTVLQ